MKNDRKFELTAEDVRRELNYDPETGEFTRKTSFFKTRIGEKAGSISKSAGYVVIAVCGSQYLAHRLAWLYTHGCWPPNFIDHINGVKTDNRIANLREATSGENMQNQRKARGNSKTGMLGVRHNKASGNYVAVITVDGRVVNVGSFKTPEQAHEAYLRAKAELHNFGTILPNSGANLERVQKKASSTGFSGVEFRSGRYRAFFHADRKTKINVGSFDTAEEASEAREKAKAEYVSRKTAMKGT